MFEDLKGKNVRLIKAEGEGTVEIRWLTVISVEGPVIQLRDSDGNLKLVNMAAPQNIELNEMP